MATHPVHRRGFNVLLGSAVAWPLVARAQQTNNSIRIGFVPLGLPTSSTDQSYVEAFRRGLRDVGLVENRDVTIDIAWVANESDYPQAVSQLLQRGAALLVTGGSTATAAAQRLTSTIPIIFAPLRPLNISSTPGSVFRHWAGLFGRRPGRFHVAFMSRRVI